MKVMYAIDTRLVHDRSTGAVLGKVQKGTHWPVDDPVVKANPDLFSDDPRWGMNYSVEPDGWDAPVETASAAPGEKRNTRRAADR